MHFSRNIKNRQAGFSIVELMVALGLSVVLVGGITQVYLENKRNYVMDEASARLQENGRFALNLLKRELKMAGYFGGVPTPAVPTADPNYAAYTGCGASGDWPFELDTGIDFVNDIDGDVVTSVGGEDFECILDGEVYRLAAGTPTTDILAIKRLADRPTVDDGDWADGVNTDEEKTDRWYLKTIITGVQSGDSVELKFIDDDGFDATTEEAAGTNVAMWLLKARIYFVRDYSFTPGDGIPTLSRATLENNQFIKEPLVEGVQAFHVEWGIPASDDDDRPVRFVADPSADQLDDATVARVYLLIRSRDEINEYTNTKTFVLGSLPALGPFNDGFLRRVFTTTVKIRNRASV